MRNVEAKQAWTLHCDYIREKNVKSKTMEIGFKFKVKARNLNPISMGKTHD